MDHIQKSMDKYGIVAIKDGVICTVDGQKVPDVHRRLICQKVSVSRNLSQKVIPSDIIKPEGHKNFYF